MMPVECVGCLYENTKGIAPCLLCSRYHQGQEGYEDHYKTLENKWQSSGTEPKKKTTRTDILETAIKMVNGSRQEDYGVPENNFSVIAKLWSAYYGCNFSAHDVAMMLGLVKVGRISNAYKKGKCYRDGYVDGAGYFSCAGEIAEEERR